MKHFGLFWKIVLILFTITSLTLLYFIGSRIYDRRYGYFEATRYISETCRLREYFNGDLKIVNAFTGKATTPRLDWISQPGTWDTTTVFSKDNKRGYLNKFSGEITIPAKYSRAWQFSEGLGAVVENSRLGFINEKGQTVIPFKFYYFADYDRKVSYQFKGGYCTAVDSCGKFGLIDKEGIWIIKPMYEYITNPIDGFRTIKLDDKYGLLDSTLKIVLPIEYDFIGIREDGFSLSKHGTQQIVAKDMTAILHPFSFDETALLEFNSLKEDEDGNSIFVTSACIPYRVHNHWGIIDRKGKVIAKAIYNQIEALSDDLFSCQSGNNWILINSKGEIIR